MEIKTIIFIILTIVLTCASVILIRYLLDGFIDITKAIVILNLFSIVLLIWFVSLSSTFSAFDIINVKEAEIIENYDNFFEDARGIKVTCDNGKIYEFALCTINVAYFNRNAVVKDDYTKRLSLDKKVYDKLLEAGYVRIE